MTISDTTLTGVPSETLDSAPIETTPPDPTPAPVEPSAPAATPIPGSREDVMAQAVASRRDEIAKEIADFTPVRDDAPAAPSAADPAPTEAAPAAPVTEPTAPAAPTAPTTVRVTINGIEQEMPITDVVAGFQTAASAHERFRQAKELRDAAAADLVEAQRLRSAPAVPAPTPIAAPPPAAPEMSDERLAELVQTIQLNEDPKKVQEAVKELAGSNQAAAAPIDVAQLTANVAAQMEAKQEFTTALAEVGAEFPRIFADRRTAVMAADAVLDLRREALTIIGFPAADVAKAAPHEVTAVYDMYARTVDPNSGKTVLPPLKALFRRACEVTEATLSRFAPQAAPATTPAPTPAPSPPAAPPPAAAPLPAAPSQRQLRKESAVVPPAGVSARSPLEATTPGPTTASDVVMGMRASRGQPVG